MNIVLCGMMGSGKTTVAEALNKAYGLTVADTDALIVERYGSIDKIFAEHGEGYFRDIEAEICREAAKNYADAVISLGGGCVLRAENVKNLTQTGKIFYLRARAETIIERLRGDMTRPLLKGNLEERVNGILAQRAHVYEGVADAVIDTDGLTPEQIAKKIKELSI